MELPKLLVTIFLEDKEISRKVFQLRSVEEVVDACKSNTGTLLNNSECHRIMKFNADFNEFIDTDSCDIIEHMDKFQVFFSSYVAHQCWYAWVYLFRPLHYNVHQY